MDDDAGSATRQRFIASVGAPITHSNIDDYDLNALQALGAAERASVEGLLVERLRAGDGRAANALKVIGSAGARQALAAALSPSSPPLVRVAAARNLCELGERSGAAAAAEVLERGDRIERLSALGALAIFPPSDSEPAVRKALDDPDATVRSSALSALVRAHGLAAYDNSYRDRLGLLHPRIASPLASVRQDAIAELDEILARHDAGESAAALGLTTPANDEQEPLR
jgi:hypothetical protein